MKTLTHEQAERLRGMRAGSRRLVDLVKRLVSVVSDACEHVQEDDSECPVCKVYRPLADADNLLHDLPDDIDGYLLRGPHPNEKGKNVARTVCPDCGKVRVVGGVFEGGKPVSGLCPKCGDRLYFAEPSEKPARISDTGGA